MVFRVTDVLANPSLYYYLRHWSFGGIPFRAWINEFGLTNPTERVADVGCGPVDILRHLKPGQYPEFYLGLDISDGYLGAARQRAAQLGLQAEFRTMNLALLPTSTAMQDELVKVLESYRITRVLLMGVVHHLDDHSALTTLRVIHRAASVHALVTQDPVYLPNHRLNNLMCAWDRGEHVRDEQGYDALVAQTPWTSHRKFFTSPGVSLIKYVHYELRK